MSVQQSLQASNRLDGLVRQVRMFQGLTFVLAGAIVVGLFGGARQPPRPRVEKFDEITVGRINVAGPNGINRIVLAHEMPQAPFQGQMLTRSVPPGCAGIIYCAPNGDEVGGIAVSGDAERGSALITLDYRNTPLEAIGLATHYGKEGQSAGFVVMSPPTGSIDITKIEADDEAEVKRLQDMMVRRIDLGASPQEAGLTIADREGNSRIVIRVNEKGDPEIVMYDTEGKETGRMPPAPNQPDK